MIRDVIEELEGVELLISGDTCRLTVPLRFDLKAILTEPLGYFVPFYVKEIALVHLPDADEYHHSAGLIEDPEDESEEWDEQYFPIVVEFKPLIDRLVTASDLLLKRNADEAKEISHLAKLRYALSRLPLTTEETRLEVILASPRDQDGSWGGLALEIRPERFSLDYVGYVSGPFGGDSDCRNVYECENSGYRSDLGEDPARLYYAIEAWLGAWEQYCEDPDMELSITDDEDDFDWDQFEDDTAWEEMPSNYV